MIAATSLSSRVTLNLPVRARAVSTRAARAAVVRVAADGEESSGYKSMNVTKPNIVNNLDGETTRNIDGKVYTITVKGDEVTVKDKFGQVFPARVNKSAIIEADLSNSVAGANKTNALQMARRTQIEHYGGGKEAKIIGVAKAGRAQLANYMVNNPNAAGRAKPDGEE